MIRLEFKNSSCALLNPFSILTTMYLFFNLEEKIYGKDVSCSSSNIEKIVLCKNLNGISIDHEINTKEGYIKEIRSNEKF